MKLLYFFSLLIFCVSVTNGISFSYAYIRYFKQRAIDIIDKAGPKDECSRHLKAWIKDLFNFKKMWALQMLDASAKFQSGYLSGNIIHWGNFDQCLQINVDKGDSGVIEGQYCSVMVSPVKNSSEDLAQVLDFVNFVPNVMGLEHGKDLKHIIRLFQVVFGVCLPKSCSADNIQKIWNHVEFTFRLPIHVALKPNFCSHKGDTPSAFYFDKYVIFGFVIYFIGILFATMYDVIVCRQIAEFRQKIWERVLTSFSLYKNFKSIFHYPSANSDNTLSCISGLKVLSMLWIVYGHRYALGYFSGSTNVLQYFEWRKTPMALIVLLAPFAVDIFLTMSGLLLAYKYMELKEVLPKNKPFPYFIFYFFRLLRLWPGLIATILFITSVMKYLNDGPFWTLAVYKISQTCTHTGWITALFMSNFVKFTGQCLDQAWYLAVDTQLYCMGPLLLYFLYKYPKSATISYLTLGSISGLYAYIVTLTNKERWLPFEGDDTHNSLLYVSTFARMPSWLLGILTGALLYNYQRIKIPKVVSIFIWTYFVLILFGIGKVTNTLISEPYSEHTAGLYNALARPAWSLAFCFLIFMCATGHGGILNKLLSLNVFKVVQKMSYSTFLLHIAIIAIVTGSRRTNSYHSGFTTLHAFLGDLPFIFGGSLVWCLAFESPFINIAKLLIYSKKSFMKAIAAYESKKFPEYSNKSVMKYSSDRKQLKTKKYR